MNETTGQQSFSDRLNREMAEARNITDLAVLERGLYLLRLQQEGNSPALRGSEMTLVSALSQDPEWCRSIKARIAASNSFNKMNDGVDEARRTARLDRLERGIHLLELMEAGKSPAMTLADMSLTAALFNDPELRASVEDQIAAAKKHS